MYFALTDDQREFDAAVRSYLAERFDLDAVRGVVEAPESDGNPAALWKAAGEQGWLAALVPEEHDGLGLGLVEAQVIARALGAGRGAGAVARHGARRRGRAPGRVRRAAGGVAAPARRGRRRRRVHAARHGPRDAARPSSTAPWPTSSWPGRATGSRSSRTRAPRRAGSYDGTTRLADVEAGAGEALPGATAEVLDRLTARATVLVAADLVGIAREAITRTVAYDRERQQFGVPVGSFQAIKHALADLHVGRDDGRARRAVRRARGGRRPAGRAARGVGGQGEGERRRARTRPPR